ncbi:class I SAM-dependent methyltransferase [Planctomycetota bacterium]
MFDPDQYSLLDFGEGRKLEKFGDVILDRPSPAAEHVKKANSKQWHSVMARYVRTSNRGGKVAGKWSGAKLPSSWTVQHADATFELKPTDFGHVGIFVEQAENWKWITRQIRRHDRTLKVLNLFAYTGGSTLAAAAAGAEVTHVDSSKSVVTWARRNAELSSLSDAPIRWLVEDCQKFVQRELKRGNHYDAVILDPPSYGHGTKGEAWKLSRDLMPLLEGCAELTSQSRAFLLLTCHSPGFGAAELSACLEDTFFGHCQTGARAKRLTVTSVDGRALDAGAVARWPS